MIGDRRVTECQIRDPFANQRDINASRDKKWQFGVIRINKRFSHRFTWGDASVTSFRLIR